MSEKRRLEGVRYQYPAADWFRIAAAFMVIAIHTGPFSMLGEDVDYCLTYCLARVGVPFFFALTGFFVVGRAKEREGLKGAAPFLRKTALLYLVSILLYLPVGWYAGNLSGSFGEALKAVLVDGTFYHLWYLPAVWTGVVIVLLLCRVMGFKGTAALSLLLYILGVFGDSWYGLAEKIPLLPSLYEGLFQFSSYTRNGIFFAPVFLCLGAYTAQNQEKYAGKKDVVPCLFALFLSLALCLGEGWITRSLGWQRHNSMYFMLLFVLFFGMRLLMDVRAPYGKNQKKYIRLRRLSMLIYLLHPLCIIGLRGGAGVLGVKEALVSCSLLYYLLVCLTSAACSGAVLFGYERLRGIISRKRRNDG